MKAKASKVGQGGLRPLTPAPDTRSAADDVTLAKLGKGGLKGKNISPPSNGRSMGTKVSGGANLDGGVI